jgi:hypothetical protein
MPDINALAVLVASISVFVLSSVYYTTLARPWASVSEAAARGGGRPRPRKAALELARTLILATVVAGLASRGEIENPGGGLFARARTLGRVPVRALDGRDALGEHALEARRHPRRRLAPEAARDRPDRE